MTHDRRDEVARDVLIHTLLLLLCCVLKLKALRAAERLQRKRRVAVLRRQHLVGDDPVGRLRVVQPVPADAPAAVGARLPHLGAPARLPGLVVVGRAAAAAARRQRLTEPCRIILKPPTTRDR